MYSLSETRQEEPRLLKAAAACSYTSMGKTSFTKWADEIGAVVKFGKSVFYDRRVIDRAIDEMAVGNK